MAVLKNRTNRDNFLVVSKIFLQDKELSLTERGLLATMHSLPDDWDFTIAGMGMILPDGESKIKSALDGLICKGYVTKKQSKDSNGKFGKNIIEVNEKPLCEKPLAKNPLTGNPLSFEPPAENYGQYNINKYSNKGCSNNQSINPSYETSCDGLLVTLLQIIQKPLIRKDFMNMVGEMVLFGKGIYQGTLTAGLFVAKLGDMIPNDIFSKIAHWILLILVMVTVLCGLGALIVIGFKKYVTFVYKSQKDKITAIAGIVVLAIGLYLSDVIKSILSINIIVLMLVLFMGYTIVRALIELRKVELGKKRGMYLLVGVIGLGIYVLLIHFWGCIPAVAVPIGCLFAFEEQ